MQLGLTIGKWTLMVLIWVLIFMTFSQSIDEMVIIKFSLALFYIIVVVTVAFAIFNFAENPKSGVKFIISALALGVIILLSYQSSSDLDPETGALVEGGTISEAGIYTFYVSLSIALVLLVFSEVKRILKI